MLTTQQKTLRKFWYATVRLELIEWDRAIITEDREVLESTSPDAILDVSRRVEQHMPSDRPGMIMRRRLLELLREHGEEEVTRAYA